MSLAVRLEVLRKVYTSPAPAASIGRSMAGPVFWASGRSRERRRAAVTALEGITLEVRPGELFGLLGPNGAGKSTTIGILTTRVIPTGGNAWIGDHDVRRDPVAVKRLIGVVPQRPNLDLALTAREILLFHGAYFGLPREECARRAQRLLEQFRLLDRADQLVRAFSGGMMQRLSIARALMHEPAVLFLDEPSVGLDPQARLLLWNLIRDSHERGTTIVLTTHNMEEADALCQRLAIIDHGRVIAEGTPADLKKTVPGGHLIGLHFDGGIPEELPREIAAISGVTEVRAPAEDRLEIYAERGGPLVPPIVTAAARTGARLTDLHLSDPSLENLFLHLTGRSLRE
jgi:ABC-2 type transport system ATP-binding protein